MTRDERIDGGIRVLGVFVFCNGVIQLAYLVTLNIFEPAVFLIGLDFCAYFAVCLALGLYLMRGGKAIRGIICSVAADRELKNPDQK